MRQVPIDEFGPDVARAIERARDSYPRFGPGVRVCVADTNAQTFAEIELANNAQVSQLAVALVELGFVLTTDSVDDCDFVLDESARR